MSSVLSYFHIVYRDFAKFGLFERNSARLFRRENTDKIPFHEHNLWGSIFLIQNVYWGDCYDVIPLNEHIFIPILNCVLQKRNMIFICTYLVECSFIGTVWQTARSKCSEFHKTSCIFNHFALMRCKQCKVPTACEVGNRLNKFPPYLSNIIPSFPHKSNILHQSNWMQLALY